MTALDHAQYILGILCLTGMAWAAVWTIWTSVAPRWREIVQLATGQVAPALFPIATRGRVSDERERRA